MAWEIVAYQDEQARQPVNDFIASLPQKDQARIYWTLDLLREFGLDLKMPTPVLSTVSCGNCGYKVGGTSTEFSISLTPVKGLCSCTPFRKRPVRRPARNWP